jgi:YD repeat-containing protein
LYGYNHSEPIAEAKNAQNTVYLTTTPSTAAMTVNIGGPLPGTIQRTYTFNVDYTGTVTLKLGVTGSPSYSTVASYSGITTGSTTLAIGSCGQSVIQFSNVSPGTYSLTITLSTTASGVTSLGACGEIDYPQNVISSNPSGIAEFLYESFEENNSSGVINNPANAHCGKSYFSGPYTTSFVPPNSRNYIIEYWYLSGTTWKFTSVPYSGNGMVLNNGSAIDDVRIFPADAQMKTYTYDPVLGMTSSIDESGRAFMYDYDTFGRLLRIRNDNGGTEKQYQYNYKGN